ncbi:MAG TPA: LysE family transporter [Gaiellaceae bacterium]|jgi:chemosensory pili system protein ChpE
MRLILFAVLLALAYSAVPGPVIAETLRRGLSNGFRAALAVELGSLAGDALWIGLMFVGAAALAEAGGLRLALGAIGGLFLLWLGVRALSSARRKRPPASGGVVVEQAFTTGAAMSVASPYALPFWIAVSGSLSGYGVSSSGALGYTVFSAAFMLTCVAFALTASGVIAWGRRFLRPRFFFIVDLIGGLVFVAIGLNLISMTAVDVIG